MDKLTNTLSPDRTKAKQNLVLGISAFLILSVGVFFLSYSAFLRGKSKQTDATFISADMTLSLHLWPSVAPSENGYPQPETFSTLLAVERAVLTRAERLDPGVRCIHAASLFDPAPNILALRPSAEKREWKMVHNPRVMIDKEGEVRPVRHVSLKDPTVFRVWMMAKNVTLESDRDDDGEPKRISVVITDESLANCLQTIKAIVEKK